MVFPRLSSNKYVSCYGCNKNIRSSAHSCAWKNIVDSVCPDGYKGEWITPETGQLYKNIRRVNNHKIIIASNGWSACKLVFKYNGSRDRVDVDMSTGNISFMSESFVGFKHNECIYTDLLIYSAEDFMSLKCATIVYNTVIDDLSE